MLNNRLQAAGSVAADFIRAENAADEAAQFAASCVATMLKVRAEAKLPVRTGLQALQLVSEAAADLVRARQRMVEAHAALVDVRDEIGLRNHFAYGDEGNCPPSLTPTGERAIEHHGVKLSVVA